MYGLSFLFFSFQSKKYVITLFDIQVLCFSHAIIWSHSDKSTLHKKVDYYLTLPLCFSLYPSLTIWLQPPALFIFPSTFHPLSLGDYLFASLLHWFSCDSPPLSLLLSPLSLYLLFLFPLSHYKSDKKKLKTIKKKAIHL